jgi:hypothetical protein
MDACLLTGILSWDVAAQDTDSVQGARYNPAMSGATARRAGTIVLLFMLLVVPLLAILPGSPGSIRIAGVSLLWWYAGLIAPVTATALTIGILAAAD